MAFHHSGGAPPSDALIELLAPDGYYRYLGVPKPDPTTTAATTSPAPSGGGAGATNVAEAYSSSSSEGSHNGGGGNSRQRQSQGEGDDQQQKDPLLDGRSIPPVDEELVRKQYRKLSRRHHPDRPGGDADTFRLLNRAQRVLLNPKLRHQYDILGVDLDEDEEEEPEPDAGDAADAKDGKGDDDHHHHQQQKEPPSTAQGIIQEIAVSWWTANNNVGRDFARAYQTFVRLTPVVFSILTQPCPAFSLFQSRAWCSLRSYN